MSKGARVFVDSTGLRLAIARLQGVSSKKITQVKKRTQAELTRKIKPEASRQISEHQLNLSPGQISPYVRVKNGSAGGLDYVAVTASDERLPLRVFKPRFSRTQGVTVKTWKDAAPLRLQHAFARGRDPWQRIPGKGPSGLVPRLMIVQRKGPSMKRTLQPDGPSKNTHNRDRVVDNLVAFTRRLLATEIERQLNL